MLHLLNGLKGLASRRWLLVPAAAFGLSVLSASPAAADDRGRYDRGRYDRGDSWRRDAGRRHDEHRDDGRRHESRHDHYRRGRDNDRRIDVDIRIGTRRPEYETREVRVWVPPVYRTVVDRRWVEPVYRTEIERVWVPERCEEREVRYRHRGRLCTRVERVVVEPGHYESVERRVCVSEGHWENCERQELVCAGHYETRTERVRVPHRMSPFDVVNPMLGRVGVAGL